MLQLTKIDSLGTETFESNIHMLWANSNSARKRRYVGFLTDDRAVKEVGTLLAFSPSSPIAWCSMAPNISLIDHCLRHEARCFKWHMRARNSSAGGLIIVKVFDHCLSKPRLRSAILLVIEL